MKIKIDRFMNDSHEWTNGDFIFIVSKFGTFSIHEDERGGGLSIMERSDNYGDISIIPYLGNSIFIKKIKGQK
jgi:hypothetical protein